jgi:putative phage-type endonuclease
MATEHDKEREHWLEERRKSLGASEVATVLGCNPWETPLQLYGRKTGQLPDKPETQAMKMGHLLEPTIEWLYSDETKRPTSDPGEFAIFRNPNYPWLHATLDRNVEISSVPSPPVTKRGVLELKAPGPRMADEWAEGIPLAVQVQIQVQMWVAGLDWGSAAALIGGQDFRWADVKLDTEFVGRMLRVTEIFWAKVRKREPPGAQATDVETLRLLHPEHATGETLTLPDAAIDYDRVRTAAKEDIKRATAAVDFCDAKLMELLGDAERGDLPGGGAYTWKTSRVKAYLVPASTRRTLRRVK